MKELSSYELCLLIYLCYKSQRYHRNDLKEEYSDKHLEIWTKLQNIVNNHTNGSVLSVKETNTKNHYPSLTDLSIQVEDKQLLCKFLDDYSGCYKDDVLKEYTKDRNLDEPLFLGKQGKRLDRSQVYRFIKHACKVLNIDIHCGTHTLRRTFGYHHYQKYKDAVILQKIFNHSSQRITLMYIGVEQDEIDWSYKNFEL